MFLGMVEVGLSPLLMYKEYEIYDAQFNLIMTPHSLYRELLSAHNEAIKDAKLAQAEINKKIDLAQKMIEEGSDPTFVSKITDLSPEIIKQFHRDKCVDNDTPIL